MEDLKAVETHFAFGENWSEYAAHIDDRRIEEAEKGLLRLIKEDEIKGKTFLDIGCGSGLHALAALKQGASSVLATDIDEHSVATTKRVLEGHAPNGSYKIEVYSVFDLPTAIHERFDIVYSWGVLHHTGSMYEAITQASEMVKPGGLFAIALYRKTPMCGVWKHIKRWYTSASKANQRRAQNLYISLLKFRYLVTFKNFEVMRNSYQSSRGMSFEHDVHDWLGGYPYESITPKEIEEKMKKLAFTLKRSIVHKGGLGLFGSGCDEFVFEAQDK